jgi:hypothetical protein
LFIKYVPGCGFATKNPPKRIKLKRHFKLCFLGIGSCNISTVSRITKLYSDLVHDLLQVEKHDELTLRNHYQCSVGSGPLPEVHYNVKSSEKGDGSKNQHKKFGKFNKGKRNGKNMTKGQGKGKGKAFTCHKCGGPNHFARKC